MVAHSRSVVVISCTMGISAGITLSSALGRGAGSPGAPRHLMGPRARQADGSQPARAQYLPSVLHHGTLQADERGWEDALGDPEPSEPVDQAGQETALPGGLPALGPRVPQRVPAWQCHRGRASRQPYPHPHTCSDPPAAPHLPGQPCS